MAKKKKTVKQTGSRKSVAQDRARKAKPPGKRISKTGKKYYESRKNRSDKKGSKL
jgi:hypothetical protein